MNQPCPNPATLRLSPRLFFWRSFFRLAVFGFACSSIAVWCFGRLPLLLDYYGLAPWLVPILAVLPLLALAGWIWLGERGRTKGATVQVGAMLLAGLGLLAGAKASAFAWTWAGNRALQHEIQKADAQGLTPGFPAPSAPDLSNRNSVSFFNKIPSFPPEERTITPQDAKLLSRVFSSREPSIPASLVPQLRTLLAGHQAFMDFVERGLACPNTHWNLSYDPQTPWKTQVPEVGWAVEYTKLKCIQALLDLKKGRLSQARACLDKTALLSRDLLRTPQLVNTMAAVTCMDWAYRAVRSGRVLNRTFAWDSRGVEKTLAPETEHDLRLQILGFCEAIGRQSGGRLGLPYPAGFDGAAGVRFACSLLACPRLPAAEALARQAALKKASARELWSLSYVAMPWMEQMAFKAREPLALRRLADLDLACQSYRQKYGDWPKGITDLEPFLKSPDDATDPMTGGLLKMKYIQGRIILYSVGERGTGDGTSPAAPAGGSVPIWPVH